MDGAAASTESHGKLVPVSAQAQHQFHLVFSNKTESDAYCLGVWGKLTSRGVQVWQQQKNIPKDSENWFSEWFPSANQAVKVVCFISAAYIKSPYCMKEFRVAQGMDKLLVVACEPVQAIRAVDPMAYPHASDALAYLMGGGQVVFHDTDDVESEIMKFIVSPVGVGGMEPEPQPQPSALGMPPTFPRRLPPPMPPRRRTARPARWRRCWRGSGSPPMRLCSAARAMNSSRTFRMRRRRIWRSC